MTDVINEIKSAMKEQGISYSDLSQLSGIPLSTIKKVLSGQTKNPRVDTLQALLDAVGARSGYQYVRVELTPEEIENLERLYDTIHFNGDFNDFIASIITNHINDIDR